MTGAQLFPRPRRRMKQPTKQALRDRIAEQDSEIDRLRAELEPPYSVDEICRRFKVGPISGALLRQGMVPSPPNPPPPRDVTGRNYRRPWWHRIFRRAA